MNNEDKTKTTQTNHTKLNKSSEQHEPRPEVDSGVPDE